MGLHTSRLAKILSVQSHHTDKRFKASDFCLESVGPVTRMYHHPPQITERLHADFDMRSTQHLVSHCMMRLVLPENSLMTYGNSETKHDFSLSNVSIRVL